MSETRNSERMIQDGFGLLAAKRHAEAEAMFRAAGDAPAAWHGLGECALARGALDEAIGSFERALSAAPEALPSLVSLSDVALWRHGLAGWEGAIDRALALPVVGGPSFHFLVRKACLLWVSRRVGLARAILQEFGWRLNQEGEPLARLLQGYTMSIAGHLDGLLTAEANGKGGHYETGTNPPTALFVGDSHGIAPAGTIVRIGGVPHRVGLAYVLGCKAWHLANDRPNPYKSCVAVIADGLAQPTTIIASAGDIDCRIDSGFFNQVVKTGADPEPAITTTVEGYLDHLQARFSPGGHRLIILAPPAPRPSARPRPPKALEMVSRISAAFNAALKTAAARRGLAVIDYYAMTVGADGWATGDHHVDQHHLNADALRRAAALAGI